MRLVDMGRIEGAGDAVLGAENGAQLDIRQTCQQVDAAPALGVHPGLIGHQSNPAGPRNAACRTPGQVFFFFLIFFFFIFFIVFIFPGCRTILPGYRTRAPGGCRGGRKQRSTPGHHVESGLHLSVARL